MIRPPKRTVASSSFIISRTVSADPPPVPAPMSGNAIELNCFSSASASALRQDCRIDHSLDRHHRLMPATWMMALNGRSPALVRAAQYQEKGKRNCPVLGKFAKRSVTATSLDRSRDSLRKKQPPRDDVSIPGVDDCIDVLIEKVALCDFDFAQE